MYTKKNLSGMLIKYAPEILKNIDNFFFMWYNLKKIFRYIGVLLYLGLHVHFILIPN